MSHDESVKALEKELLIFQGLKCRGGKLYLGSMFFLDFGSLIPTKTSKDETVETAELTLSIRDVAWWIYRDDLLVASAESVAANQFCDLVEELKGVEVLAANYDSIDDRMRILFQRGWRLQIDLSNMWDSETDVLELALPDGRLMAVSKDGELIRDAGFDDVRARFWAQSLKRH